LPAKPAEVLDAAAAPRLSELRDILRRDYPLFGDAVDRTAAAFGRSWIEDFEETLGRVCPSSELLAHAAKGYALFAIDHLRRQRQFERDRRYAVKSYDEAAAQVYLDEAYMRMRYLPGMLIAHFVWLHEYHHMRFFDSAFVSQLQLRADPVFAEVGVGSGVYSRRVLQQVPSARGTGYDISPSSKAFAEDHMRAFGLEDRYEGVLADAMADPMQPVEWLICIEVLEHLEDPTAWLRRLRETVIPGGRAFITAALNAAQLDHIYLYESSEDVIQHLEAAGFAVEQGFLATAYSPPTPGIPVPAVAAFIVS
jgi:2-polyprenyl-3-methyl-5-hydroxy-6-metoxy-1,4-benzoquinol methylase